MDTFTIALWVLRLFFLLLIYLFLLMVVRALWRDLRSGISVAGQALGRLLVIAAPEGQRRISVSAEEGTSTISLLDTRGDAIASTTAEGLVSHLRWSPDGERVVFTLGRSASGGGVLQDLFLWDRATGTLTSLPVPNVETARSRATSRSCSTDRALSMTAAATTRCASREQSSWETAATTATAAQDASTRG